MVVGWDLSHFAAPSVVFKEHDRHIVGAINPEETSRPHTTAPPAAPGTASLQAHAGELDECRLSKSSTTDRPDKQTNATSRRSFSTHFIVR
jgi:hypothetical protein